MHSFVLHHVENILAGFPLDGLGAKSGVNCGALLQVVAFPFIPVSDRLLRVAAFIPITGTGSSSLCSMLCSIIYFRGTLGHIVGLWSSPSTVGTVFKGFRSFTISPA